LILLAHSLELDVVAEGVEDAATLTLLKSLGCDKAQGFLISQALAPEAFVAWWRAHEARTRPAASPVGAT
jgi:sensor c-di-GMP phosphodiesterase-like protein